MAQREASSLKRLLKPERSEYGYGVIVDSYGGWKRISHGGSVVGSAAQVEYYPAKDASIVVLSNGDALGVSMGGLLTDLRRILRGVAVPTWSLRSDTFSREVAKVSGAALFVLFSGRPTAQACLALGLGWCVWTASRRRSSTLSALESAVGGLAGAVLMLEFAGAPPPLLLPVLGLTGYAAGLGVLRTRDGLGEPDATATAARPRRPLQATCRALEMAVIVAVLALLVTTLAARDRGALASGCGGVAIAVLTSARSRLKWRAA